MRKEIAIHNLYALKQRTRALSNHEALDMAIKALEQQPCVDCISRKDVNVLIDELARAISDERCFMSRGRSTANIMQDILDLPSVTPKPKTGRWIDIQYFKADDTYYRPKCPFCGIEPKEYSNYCPECGARMEEVEE